VVYSTLWYRTNPAILVSPRKGHGYASAWIREATRETEPLKVLSDMEMGTLEFTAYLDSPVETSSSDVIGWWGVSQAMRFCHMMQLNTSPLAQVHSNTHRTWAKIARDYLAIQGSAVPCERVFSSSGVTGTDRRNRLTPQVFEALQLLKHAYHTATFTVEDEIEETNGYMFKEWESEDDEM
jgi:hypothetical protein